LPGVSVIETGLWGFTYPSDFVEAGKPVKTHLEEVNLKSPSRRDYSVGLAVDPIKLESLELFGSPQFVGKRIIHTELKREGVTNATLDRSMSTLEQGNTYYDVEYSSESTRGLKHIVSR
jgi:hypothetical protein